MEMPGAGDCAFEAMCAMLPRGSGWNPRSLREAVVDDLLREGMVSTEYASAMRQEGTWATDVELMQAAQLMRRLVVVVVTRQRRTPAGVHQDVIQEFEPAVHDARMVVVNRPGHSNATSVKVWSLNERGRRKVRTIASVVISAGLEAAAGFGLSQWRQQMDSELHEEAQLMEFGGWEVKLEEWNGGVMVADFWPSARRLEELQDAAKQREEDHEIEVQEYARAAGVRNAEAKVRAAVELKAALLGFEPGGLTGGCSGFEAVFFREVEPGLHNTQACITPSPGAFAAQELKDALCSAEAAIGVYVARSVQELRQATQETGREAVEATEGQQREDAAVERRNKLRGELEWRMGDGAVDSRSAVVCPMVRERG